MARFDSGSWANSWCHRAPRGCWSWRAFSSPGGSRRQCDARRRRESGFRGSRCGVGAVDFPFEPAKTCDQGRCVLRDGLFRGLLRMRGFVKCHSHLTSAPRGREGICGTATCGGRPGRWDRAALRFWSCGGDGLAAIRSDRSAAPFAHSRPKGGGAGLASLESAAAVVAVRLACQRNLATGVAARRPMTGPRRRAGQIVPEFGHIYARLPKPMSPHHALWLRPCRQILG